MSAASTMALRVRAASSLVLRMAPFYIHSGTYIMASFRTAAPTADDPAPRVRAPPRLPHACFRAGRMPRERGGRQGGRRIRRGAALAGLGGQGVAPEGARVARGGR